MTEQKYLENLYKWTVIVEDPEVDSDAYFIEQELMMMHYGIRTKVLPLNTKIGFGLCVPQKDSEIAYALINKEVHEVIDVPKDPYHVFESNLNFKNNALYENKYQFPGKFIRFKNYAFIGVIILVILVFLRFVNFL